MSTQNEELDALLLDWEAGELDDASLERLRDMLKRDEGARAHFLRMQLLRAALQMENDAGMPPGVDPTPVPGLAPEATPPLRRRFNAAYLLIGALSLTVCVLAAWIVVDRVAGPESLAGRVAPGARSGSGEATAHGVALLTRLVDVTWEPGQTPLEVGAALSPGRFSIAAGHAQIEFLCGATLIVEGPADLVLDSATQARVRNGRLRAHVPPAARGFQLEADGLQVVDLGTEFGLSVSEGSTNVQVFDGEVELHQDADEARLLTAGQGIVRGADGEFREAPVTPERFVDVAGLETRAQVQQSARYERWRKWSAGVRRDPRLVAYYAFDRDGDWGRRLVCSNEPADSELDGAIVGAREVAGRWPAKRGLEFKQPADRVRMQIPGEFGSLTLACWVQIDSLDRWYNSLFLTDGYDKGEPHWQILDSGQLYFSVRPVERGEPGPLDFKALSPAFWDPSLNGKWIHLAVTCDVEAGEIIHYLNGEVLSRHRVPREQMPLRTRIGTASLGNWAAPTMPEAEFAIRNLNGSIDELAIFAATLTADEIQEMYEHGKP